MEDGAERELPKGAVFQRQNPEKNPEHLVVKRNKNHPTGEVAFIALRLPFLNSRKCYN
jgi:hypothetical protein